MAALALAPRVRSPFYGACAAGLALWLAVPAGQITPSGGRGPLGSIWESVFFFSLVDTTRSAARYFAWTGIFGLAALAIGLYFEKMALNAIGRGAE